MKTIMLVVVIIIVFICLVAIVGSAGGSSGGSGIGSGSISDDPSITLSKIANMEDGEDKENARLRFKEHIAILSANVIENPSHIADIIYNTKNILKGKGINQTLLQCSSDLSRIIGSQRFELVNAAIAYCTARIALNESRESAIRSASAIVLNNIAMCSNSNQGARISHNEKTATNPDLVKDAIAPIDISPSEIVIERSMSVNTKYTNKEVNVTIIYTGLIRDKQGEEKVISALRDVFDNSVYDSYDQAEIKSIQRVNSDKRYRCYIKSVVINAQNR